MKAYNLKEAMDFFLENANGSIICVNDDGEEKECDSFPEAKQFLTEDRNE
ncbi:MAG: hypothetical protein ACOC90_04645 [Bacteroidota bacterium]